jgi:hypothetical protein
MPNFVDNTLRVVMGDPKEVFEFIRSEESIVDLNNVIPMPARVCALVAAQEDAAPIHTFSDGTTVKLLRVPPGSFREDWNRENWGTKWNAIDAAYSAEDPEHVVAFSTAWNAPTPVFEAMAKRFAAHEIVIHSVEENHAFNVIFTLKKGQVAEVEDVGEGAVELRAETELMAFHTVAPS